MTATARQAAEKWIVNYLRTKGPTEGSIVRATAEAEGFRHATIYRAVLFLNVIKTYDQGSVIWSLPAERPEPGPVPDEHGFHWAGTVPPGW